MVMSLSCNAWILSENWFCCGEDQSESANSNGVGVLVVCTTVQDKAQIGAVEGQMGCESGATLGTDLDDLLAFEHLGHHVPQFL